MDDRKEVNLGTGKEADIRKEKKERTGEIDFGSEYAEGFTKRLYIQQIQKTAIQSWIDRFPADVILEKLEQLGNPEATKEVKEQLQTNVQGWLKELNEMNESSKTLNIDLLKTASILARKDRERVE